MTVALTSTQTITGLGNGVLDEFTIGFPFHENAHLRVYLQDESTTPYTRTLLEEGNDPDKYEVTGGTPPDFDPGTTIVMGTPPTATQRLIIERVTPRTQPVDYEETAGFPAADHEEQMDRAMLVIQELGRETERGIRAPAGDDVGLDMRLPPATERAGKFLSFDEDGQPTVENSEMDDALQAVADAEAAADAAATSAAAAAASAAAAAASEAAAAASAALAATGAIPTITGSRGAPQDITAGGGIGFTGSQANATWFVQGSGGPVTVTANPRIAAGTTVGQRLKLKGRSDVNTLTIPNGQGVEQNGDVVLGDGSVIEYEWDGTVWGEDSRNDL